MKKLLAALIALMMLMCSMVAFAENQSLDMKHDTAIAFIDDAEYNFTLDSIDDTSDSGLVATYTSDDGEVLIVIVNWDLTTGSYHESGDVEDDVFGVGFIMQDGQIYTSTCSETSIDVGNPCSLAVAAFDEDGWYQLASSGTLLSEDGNTTHEIVMACDFMYNGAGYTAEEETVESEEMADEDYFVPDTALLNVGGNIYEMTVFQTELDDGIYAMYSMEGTNYMFALGIDTDLTPGVYSCADADGELVYCAFIDENSNIYYGGCSNNVGDTFGECEVVVVSAGENDLYQIAVIGEVIDEESGKTLEIAGFADFTFAAE